MPTPSMSSMARIAVQRLRLCFDLSVAATLSQLLSTIAVFATDSIKALAVRSGPGRQADDRAYEGDNKSTMRLFAVIATVSDCFCSRYRHLHLSRCGPDRERYRASQTTGDRYLRASFIVVGLCDHRQRPDFDCHGLIRSDAEGVLYHHDATQTLLHLNCCA